MSEPREYRLDETTQGDTFNAGLSVAEDIKPLLTGKGPFVQGVALIELVSCYVAGHEPAKRKDVLAAFVEAVERFIPLNDRWGETDGDQ